MELLPYFGGTNFEAAKFPAPNSPWKTHGSADEPLNPITSAGTLPMTIHSSSTTAGLQAVTLSQPVMALLKPAAKKGEMVEETKVPGLG